MQRSDRIALWNLAQENNKGDLIRIESHIRIAAIIAWSRSRAEQEDNRIGQGRGLKEMAAVQLTAHAVMSRIEGAGPPSGVADELFTCVVNGLRQIYEGVMAQ